MKAPTKKNTFNFSLPSYADPGFFVRGVQARRPENSLDNVFFSSQLILQFTEGVLWFYYRENFTFPRIQRGPNIFQGWGCQTFSSGDQMLISLEKHITCDFPGGGGGGPPISTLDLHIAMVGVIDICAYAMSTN